MDDCIRNSELAVKYDSEAYYAMFNISLATLCNGKFEESLKLYKQFKELAVSENNDGALQDLNDLIEKGIMVEEAKFIIKEVFLLQ